MGGDNRMNQANWQHAAEHILQDDPAGTAISMTTEGLAGHPHGDGHVDGWEATKLADGSVSLEKGHYYG